METSFVAVEFETANESRASICQAVIAIVKNDEVVDSKEWLIKPKELNSSRQNPGFTDSLTIFNANSHVQSRRTRRNTRISKELR